MNTYRVRVGTEAHHMLGDISRDEGGFFTWTDETEADYIGNWLTGFGFINVRFPKHSTRALTDRERERLASSDVVIA